jgi:hypothetical protein
MTCTIAHHTVILAVLPICVNIEFCQFFTIVQNFTLNTLWFELPIMEQEVSTSLLFWNFSSDNFSFHNFS